METNFPEWLLNKLEQLDMTQAELARKSGITSGQVSRILSGQRGAESKTLSAIAQALKLPPDEVYRAAGLLPPDNTINELIQQILHLTKELPPQEQQDILEFVKLRHHLTKKRGKNENRRTSKNPTIIK